MNRIPLILASALLAAVSCAPRVPVSESFEMRWFTPDPAADGETDFHGETEWLDTDGRVRTLGQYARFASAYWENPGFDKPAVSSEEIADALAAIKPQPLTSVRRTMPLNGWKAKGEPHTMPAVQDRFPLDSADWRFRMHAKITGQVKFAFADAAGKEAFSAEVKGPEATVYADFENHRLFVTDNGETRETALPDCGGASTLSIVKSDGVKLEKLDFFTFIKDPDNAHTPYYTKLLLNIDNTPQPDMDGWTAGGYDDSLWESVDLPSCHGGLLEAGEPWHLRKTVSVGDFGKAYLDIETITPSGKVWVNGALAAEVTDIYPKYLDISDFLVRNQENTIAVEVDPYTIRSRTIHDPSDLNAGWFLGTTSLILTGGCNIRSALVHTASLKDGDASQAHKITVSNTSAEPFKGSIQINYYPWFPEEGALAGSSSFDIDVPAGQESVFDTGCDLTKPALWTAQAPKLYRVELILKDDSGSAVDDYALTTGIRTIGQEAGTLYINGKPEMLDGAQIMGFNIPLETISKTAKCPTPEAMMRNMLLIKKMGNLLRIHVHTEMLLSDGTNDRRYADIADQLGLYLIWQTPAWLREGEVSAIDFEGYPKYMRQVYNHPSIVIWEASNHPNRFKTHPKEESLDYIRRIYPIISQVDTSRLISPTSFWPHMHFGNYEGTVDYHGNPMEPEPLLRASRMVRGSQDAYTGYGAKWSYIRTAPNAWAKSCLDAREQCYFNFEHEESAAQPNWELARMEPWYQVQSYEWGYEEGSIGRKLQASEWRESQAFQAFSAWESIKKQILLGYDGFSWCTIESGPNMVTYQKPLVDPFGVPKLAYYANKMAFQRIWAGSDNVDTVYGPGDEIRPVIFNLDEARSVNLTVRLCDVDGNVLETRKFKRVAVPAGRSVTYLEPFRFDYEGEDCLFVKYSLE